MPITALTAQPSATSSIRTTPTFHPTGTIRLNRTAIITVNAAWPTANGVVPGEYAATSTAIGNAIHNAVSSLPIASTSAPPSKNPIAVPAIARSAVAPVADAFVRRTDSVPSTTQKPCWTVVTSATATATASATAPRRLLTNQTERKLAWVWAAVATLDTRCTVRAAAFDPVYQRARLASSHSGSASRDAIIVS